MVSKTTSLINKYSLHYWPISSPVFDGGECPKFHGFFMHAATTIKQTYCFQAALKHCLIRRGSNYRPLLSGRPTPLNCVFDFVELIYEINLPLLSLNVLAEKLGSLKSCFRVTLRCGNSDLPRYKSLY